MAWIKRNLLFVISMAVGVILTGYCAWIYMGARDDNAAAKSALDSTISQLKDLQGKAVSKETIQQINEDTKQVKEFESKARTVYDAFPPAPKKTDQEFAAYLGQTIAELRLKATNSQIELPPDFAFAFTDWQNKLKYPPENLEPWMNQLTEIKDLCDILFNSKINALVNLRRIQVSASDTFTTGSDSLQAGPVNTPVATITPYKFTFKCFTLELANVLNGLAHSSNCFIIKNIVVYPAGPHTADPVETAGPKREEIKLPRPIQPVYKPGDDRNSYMQAIQRYNTLMAQIDAKEAKMNADQAAGVTSGGGKGSITVLREQLLQITLSVDVVKFKPADKK